MKTPMYKIRSEMLKLKKSLINDFTFKSLTYLNFKVADNFKSKNVGDPSITLFYDYINKDDEDQKIFYTLHSEVNIIRISKKITVEENIEIIKEINRIEELNAISFYEALKKRGLI